MKYKKLIKKLDEIYSKIPEFECKHCHKCCKNIIWFQPEEIQINNYLIKNNLTILDKKDNGECQFLQNDRCIIYSVRPLICRLQGLTDDLPCKFNKKLLSEKQLLLIKKKFNELLDETGGKNIFYSNRRFLDFKKFLE